jgi:murein DD-endopeptidase MepM/ murein hydrolase activator NlpD
MNMKKTIIYSLLIFVALLVPTVIYFLITSKEAAVTVKTIPANHIVYKINIDSLRITRGVVKSNQNLSSILSSHISGTLMDKIARESSRVFDVRRIKAGQKYAMITSKDSTDKLHYFVYEINPVDFVVFDFSDSLNIYLDKKEVKTVIREAKENIISSLWNTFEENNLEPNLAMKMADVYAWTVDFYGLQKGDSFKLIYEEIIVDSVSSGSGHILAAHFLSGEKGFYAFLFDDKGKKGYFDESGKSLQRSFLKAPLHFSRISSRFSRSRMHPILRIARPHFGVDYSAPKGTPVVALGDGRVAEMGWKGGYGRFIAIQHNSSYKSTYAHLSGYAKGLKGGGHVRQGEVIGYVGSSGLSTGAHLDFRVYRNGSPVDPLKLESPPTEPIAAQSRSTYDQFVKKYKSKLDSL